MNTENISLEESILLEIDLADGMTEFERDVRNLAFLGQSVATSAANCEDSDTKSEALLQLESLVNAMAYISTVHHHLQEYKLKNNITQ